MREPTFADIIELASFPRPPETCSISHVLHYSRYFYLSAESRAACLAYARRN